MQGHLISGTWHNSSCSCHQVTTRLLCVREVREDRVLSDSQSTYPSAAPWAYTGPLFGGKKQVLERKFVPTFSSAWLMWRHWKHSTLTHCYKRLWVFWERCPFVSATASLSWKQPTYNSKQNSGSPPTVLSSKEKCPYGLWKNQTQRKRRKGGTD